MKEVPKDPQLQTEDIASNDAQTTQPKQVDDSETSSVSSASSKPVMHPALATILTVVILIVGMIAAGTIGVMLGGVGLVIASLGSLLFTIPLSARLFNVKHTLANGETIIVDNNGAGKAASIGFVVFGIIVGFVIGVFVNFGACFKSECSPLEAGAPLYIPAASLLITVPFARKAFKRKTSVAAGMPEGIAPPPEGAADIPGGVMQAKPRGASKANASTIIPVASGIVILIALGFGILGSDSSYSPFSGTQTKINDQSNEAIKLVKSVSPTTSTLADIPEIEYYTGTHHDACYEVSVGDKFSARYETECAYKETLYYGFSGDYASIMRNLEQVLLNNGWSPPYGAERPIARDLDAIGPQPVSANNYQTRELVLQADYKHTENVELTVLSAQRGEEIDYSMRTSQQVTAFNNNGARSSNFQDIDKLASEIFAENDYMLALQFDYQYYSSY